MKTGLFDKLVGALDEAVEYHRGAKLDLRTTTLPDPPAAVTSETVKRVRSAVNASQAVFAHYLNVSRRPFKPGKVEPGLSPVRLCYSSKLHELTPMSFFPAAAASRKGSKPIAAATRTARKVAARGTKGGKRA